MKKKIVYIILGLIVILAICLRFYQLGHTPPSPDWDEVALGYDAYSIIHTGRDEFGKFLPVVLRSFDDYKPALYAYLSVPFVYFMGLTVLAVRLPSAIFGVISVVATFYLVKELFKRYDLALVSSFLLAISPWSIQFSRVAFEANVGDSLNILSALFLIKARKRPWLLLLSAFFAGLGIYVYQSEKAFVPLFVLLLVVIYFKDLIKLPKQYLVGSVIVGLIVVMPMVNYILTDKSALLRVKGTSILNNQTQILQTDIQRLAYEKEHHDYVGLLFDNRRVEYGKVVLAGYLSHFDLNWLMEGDIARHHAPFMGLIYIWEIPFIFIGIYLLVFGKFETKSKLAIFGWFLLAPVPASITTGVPHAVRTLNFLPTWSVFAAIGLASTFFFMKKLNIRLGIYNLKKPFSVVLVILFCCVFFLNFFYYINQYFIQLNYYDADQWQYGYAQVVPEIQKNYNLYDKIIISDKAPMDKSYMFLLFYLKYSPQKYQAFGEESGGFAVHQKFDKFEFRPIDWSRDSNLKNTLLVGLPSEFPQNVSTLKTVYFPNGQKAMVMVERN
jgi:4-amino-4-deoxy-L-arabinose transferase-like glycosyltransferase